MRPLYSMRSLGLTHLDSYALQEGKRLFGSGDIRSGPLNGAYKFKLCLYRTRV